MSMLSAQCDELRELATRYDELQAGAVKAVTMPSDMGSVLRDAANTIWELRDSVHRERVEADRLREELEAVGMAAYSYGRGDLKTENAKLRELVKEALLFGDERSYQEIGYRLKQQARELGVEVDE